MNEKDRNELRQIVAQAIADSITGRVESILTESLSPKVAHMETAKASAERAVEAANKQLTDIETRNIRAQEQFRELQSKLAQERIKFDAEMATMQKAKDAFREQINKLNQEVKETEVAAGNKVRAAQVAAGKLLADIETNLASEKLAFDREKKAHEEFRKSIGL